MIMSLTSLKVTVFVCVLTWSLLGVKKKLGPHPDRSPVAVQFKISDEHPRPFHMRVPPPPRRCKARVGIGPD